MRVAVIGAGPAGLATTIALRTRGITATCYERAGGLDRVGTGLTLWPNGLAALDTFGAGGVVRPHCLPAPGIAIRAANGRVLHHLSSAEMRAIGGNGVAVHRADLLQALSELLKPDALRFGAECTSVRPSGRVSFRDGTEVDVDLVVGADGIKSAVRAASGLGSRLRPGGFRVWRATVGYPLGLTAGELTMDGPAAVGVWRLPGDQVYWFASAPDGGLERFAGWHDPIPAVIAATPAERVVETDVHDMRPLRSWHRGRIVLVGDAAHPALPNLGQGTSQAFEDASVLAGLLVRESNVEVALCRYEEIRGKRAASTVVQAAAMARVGAWRNPFACRLREWLISSMPNRIQLRRLRTLFAFLG